MEHSCPPVGAQGQTPEVPRSVFITGASGFIGQALASRYRALGATVRGMDLRADPANDVVAGDLTRPEQWAEHARGCELFINTAAVVSLAASWAQYREVSVRGVRNCLDVAINGGAKRFVQFSSIAALGWDYPDQAQETCDVVIGDHYRYGVAKGASEHVVLAAHAAGEIDCTIVRPGDVYGPGSRAWLSEPLKMAKAGTLILPNGGSGRWTPVYIDDLLDGVMLAAGLPQASGQIFHISANESVSCQEFFGYHWRWAKRSGAPRSLPLWLALALTNAIWSINRLLKRQGEVTPDTMYMFARTGGISIDKARRLLGYEPKVCLQVGLERSEQWLHAVGQLG
ncbi:MULTISPECIES: NAD-dependent epimerase/dehydratase family protein [Pseudomonas]|uniref:3 beta-hydroxysteroid dehydrogenase/Delta 5-->4-isomerase n=1 Tax=Pseudomonas putida TaxID=303 RepID=A0A1B2F6F7_PSEPU|nr:MULTISPECIES: NAD-dependent epimerase/dehydratase family protein [Pseudomonas]ANY87797.1 3 beta-hydroxysteroid dehydrogenase/Delta 5-->4-isomerase [Pseudomonas putida]MCL8304765.1 NAD-dependent epimerase/dehydratase family protein [Pseudomonas putida]